MASSAESVLGPGEQILHLGRVSVRSQFWRWLAGALLLSAFGIGLIFLGVAWIRCAPE